MSHSIDQHPATPSAASFFTPAPDLGPSAPYGPGRQPGQPGQPGRRPGGRTRAALFATGVGAGLLGIVAILTWPGDAPSRQVLSASTPAAVATTNPAGAVPTPPGDVALAGDPSADAALAGDPSSDLAGDRAASGVVPAGTGSGAGGGSGASGAGGTGSTNTGSGSSTGSGSGSDSGSGGSGTGGSGGGSQTDGSGTQDPGTQDPGTQDPGTPDPGTKDPGTKDPGTKDPSPAAIPTATIIVLGLPGKTIHAGDTLHLQAKVAMSDGSKVPSSSVRWSLRRLPLPAFTVHTGATYSFTLPSAGAYTVYVQVANAIGGKLVALHVVAAPDVPTTPKPKPPVNLPGDETGPQKSPF